MVKRYGMWAYLAGATAARTGDEMSGPALLLAGLAVTGSAASASALLAGIMVAAAVGGPLFGALLDRSASPGRLLAVALALYAAALAAILVTLGRVPFVCTVLIAVFAGLLGPALSGGWTAQLPRLVPPERLPRANALDAATFDAAGLAGPALAGALATLSGAPTAVAFAIALISLAAPAAWPLPTTPSPHPPPTTPPALPPPATSSTRPLLGNSAGLPRSASPSGRPPALPRAADVQPDSFSAQPLPLASSARSQPGVAGHPYARVTSSCGRSRLGRSAVAAVAGDLVAGFRALARSPSLARATVASVISSAGAGMLVTCAPLLGETVLGGPGQGAVLLSLVAASALAANAVLARRPHATPTGTRPDMRSGTRPRPRSGTRRHARSGTRSRLHSDARPDARPGARPDARSGTEPGTEPGARSGARSGVRSGGRPDAVIWCSTVVLAVAMLLAASGRPVLLLLAMVVAGVAEGPQLTALFAVRHREAPERLRGQIFTTGASLKITGFALGAGLAGQVATWSLPGALLTAAGLELLAALTFAAITLAVRVRRSRAARTPRPAG
ncbi:MFS transporter [Microtetraspora sp. NBRC 13810]|uniref:MFS transporter n=1 Tax=Microtetraspora sp. NBRC 13810 TaxID=3030990 RepID=UPI00255711AA|nr:MFS transporter [Microtetraspora sp. NBRC 13810]